MLHLKPLFHFTIQKRQHQGNLDVTSDVVLSCCCCCPSTGADCRNGRFVRRSFCPLLKVGGFDENKRNSDSVFYPQKQRFCSSNPEIDENDGCHPGKMTGCQKHRFDDIMPKFSKAATAYQQESQIKRAASRK